MATTSKPFLLVSLQTGERVPFHPTEESGLFLAVLGRVLGEDYLTEMKLTNWHGVIDHCAAEVTFVAGQLHAEGQTELARKLHGRFIAWQDEFQTKALAPPENPD